MLALVTCTASSLAADRVGGSLQPEGHGGAPSRSAKLPDKTIGYCALLPRPAPSCQRPSHLWYPPPAPRTARPENVEPGLVQERLEVAHVRRPGIEEPQRHL
jgi:hypothetical protein